MSPYSPLQSPLRNTVLLLDVGVKPTQMPARQGMIPDGGPCTSTIPSERATGRSPPARDHPIPYPTASARAVLHPLRHSLVFIFRRRKRLSMSRPRVPYASTIVPALRTVPARSRLGPSAPAASSRPLRPATHETRRCSGLTHSMLCCHPLDALHPGTLVALRMRKPFLSSKARPRAKDRAFPVTRETKYMYVPSSWSFRTLTPRTVYVHVRPATQRKRKDAIPEPQILIPLPNVSSSVWRVLDQRTTTTPLPPRVAVPHDMPHPQRPEKNAHTAVFPPRVGYGLIAPPRPTTSSASSACMARWCSPLSRRYECSAPPPAAPGLSFIPRRATTTPHHKLLFLRMGR
ncbi:hypothetical protein C8J57DRAFT_1720502 [Mycena rebaudengoi]|nr:hypothetical protein C8J57DRAFT_1720502 [Mycena rebaudengoi]